MIIGTIPFGTSLYLSRYPPSDANAGMRNGWVAASLKAAGN